jgi:hypothetical protein
VRASETASFSEPTISAPTVVFGMTCHRSPTSPSGLVERRLGQTAAPPGFGEGRKWRVRLAAADSAGRLDGVAVEQLLAHG